jgi:hypothetical protein
MPRLLAGLAHYAMNRKFIKPSTCRLALNRSAVVVIGVRRGGVGRDNGACPAALPCALREPADATPSTRWLKR